MRITAGFVFKTRITHELSRISRIYRIGMRYLYGPVQSRRLGYSLGITLTGHKVCSFDCVYCQLGRTTVKTLERKRYCDIEEVVAELKEYFEIAALKKSPLDCISLSGFGEPMLNLDIARLMSEIKKLTPIPLVLITNASLFSDAKARAEGLEADIIVPSLDAVTQDVFEAIDRPAAKIKIGDILDGLIALRSEFKGKIYLEIMLLKGLNDGLDYAYKLKEAVDKINPDKIQLNTPVRSTTESWAKLPERGRLLEIKDILGSKCEII